MKLTIEDLIKQIDEAIDSLGHMGNVKLSVIGVSCDAMVAIEALLSDEYGHHFWRDADMNWFYWELQVIYIPFVDTTPHDAVLLTPTHRLGTRLTGT